MINSVGKHCKFLLQHSEFHIVLLHTNTCSKQYLIRGSNNNKNRKYWTFVDILLHLERASIFHISFRLCFTETRQWSSNLLYSFFFLFPDIYYLKFWFFSFHENLLKWLDLCLWHCHFQFFLKSLSASYLRFSMWAVNFQLYLPSLLFAITDSKPLESWCKYTQSFVSCRGFRKAISTTFKLAANPFNYSRSNTVIALCY